MTSGVSDGTAPERPITREELVTMLWRLAGSPAPADPLTERADIAEASDWARAALAWAVGAGMMQGDENGYLNPRSGATRAEAAQLLMNFISAGYCE